VYHSEAQVKSYCDQTAACLGYYAAANNAYWRGLHAGHRVNFWYTGNHGFTVRKKPPPPPPTYVNSLVNNADDSGETVYHSEAQVKSYCDQTAACLGYYAAANNAYWRGLHAGHRVNFWYTGNHGFTVRKKENPSPAPAPASETPSITLTPAGFGCRATCNGCNPAFQTRASCSSTIRPYYVTNSMGFACDDNLSAEPSDGCKTKCSEDANCVYIGGNWDRSTGLYRWRYYHGVEWKPTRGNKCYDYCRGRPPCPSSCRNLDCLSNMAYCSRAPVRTYYDRRDYKVYAVQR